MNNATLKTIDIKPNSHAYLTGVLSTALCAVLCGCGTARISNRREIAVAPARKPAIIYISDFQLDPATVKSRAGLLPPSPRLPGPLGAALPPLPGTPKDSNAVAREVVDAMSVSLVKDLNKAGLRAQRLATNAPMPSSGWLVRGVFTDVNQGNQINRAVIGFGSGKTDLHVLVDINDLAQGVPKSFYQLNTVAESGKAPGAGPTFAAAARFVIASKDLERNVQQTASQISAEVVQRTQPTTIAAASR